MSERLVCFISFLWFLSQGRYWLRQNERWRAEGDGPVIITGVMAFIWIAGALAIAVGVVS